MSEPTQVRHPTRTTARSVFQFIVALAAVLPLIVAGAGLSNSLPIVGIALAVAASITRVMAIPQVNEFLEKYVPVLGARPRT